MFPLKQVFFFYTAHAPFKVVVPVGQSLKKTFQAFWDFCNRTVFSLDAEIFQEAPVLSKVRWQAVLSNSNNTRIVFSLTLIFWIFKRILEYIF